ncbi:TPA: hypothetical protein L4958_006609 [Pseudomonas aeruginosa]|nr:hypothetical protein [Pseudomonas aeruginosa]HBO7040058.1 hypothetical protein [Pseudomonas aeruginosa]
MRRSKLTRNNRILKPEKLAHQNHNLTEAIGLNLCKNNGFQPVTLNEAKDVLARIWLRMFLEKKPEKCAPSAEEANAVKIFCKNAGFAFPDRSQVLKL